MTTEDRKNKALELHAKGYNCAQCVVLAFADVTGVNEELGARIAMGLGGGVGAQGEICGVITGMAITDGLLGGPSPTEKPAANRRVREMTESFKSGTEGCVTCRDLKGKCKRSCDSLIADGIEILASRLENA